MNCGESKVGHRTLVIILSITPRPHSGPRGPRPLATAATGSNGNGGIGIDTRASMRHPQYRLHASASAAAAEGSVDGMGEERRQALRRLVASVLRTRGA